MQITFISQDGLLYFFKHIFSPLGRETLLTALYTILSFSQDNLGLMKEKEPTYPRRKQKPDTQGKPALKPHASGHAAVRTRKAPFLAFVVTCINCSWEMKWNKHWVTAWKAKIATFSGKLNCRNSTVPSPFYRSTQMQKLPISHRKEKVTRQGSE